MPLGLPDPMVCVNVTKKLYKPTFISVIYSHFYPCYYFILTFYFKHGQPSSTMLTNDTIFKIKFYVKIFISIIENNNKLRTSVVIIRQDADGLIVTSPVTKPTSLNSS